jgi:hypothetical protein
MQEMLLKKETTKEDFSLPVMLKLIEIEFPGKFSSSQRAKQLDLIFGVTVSELEIFQYYNIAVEDFEFENRKQKWKLELT